MRYFTLGVGLVVLAAVATGCTIKDPNCADVSAEVHGVQVFECNDMDTGTPPDEVNSPDEDCPDLPAIVDLDGDGYGAIGTLPDEACDGMVENQVDNTDDCDDANAAINPEEVEIPSDDIDQDCDGIDPAWQANMLQQSGGPDSIGGVFAVDGDELSGYADGTATPTRVEESNSSDWCTLVTAQGGEVTAEYFFVSGDLLYLGLEEDPVILPGDVDRCVVDPVSRIFYLLDSEEAMIYVVEVHDGEAVAVTDSIEITEPEADTAVITTAVDILVVDGVLHMVDGTANVINSYTEGEGWTSVIDFYTGADGDFVAATALNGNKFAVLTSDGTIAEARTDSVWRPQVVGITSGANRMAWVAPGRLLVSGPTSVELAEYDANTLHPVYTTGVDDEGLVVGVASTNYPMAVDGVWLER